MLVSLEHGVARGRVPVSVYVKLGDVVTSVGHAGIGDLSVDGPAIPVEVHVD